MSWIIVELAADISNLHRHGEGLTNQRILLPDLAVNSEFHQMLLS